MMRQPEKKDFIFRDVSDDPEVAVLRLVGQFHSENAPELMKRIKELFEDSVVRIELDLHGVSFVGTAVIGGFVYYHRFMKRFDGELVLKNTPEGIMETFHRLNLASLLKFN